ncbi:MAG: hypothetical protein A2096_06670 [Spirochaetes bacterium GWF1_41_5]|nr:MAG: hypothetical protein A2096_06670 [Spirochaetes bacterium GWF1_41_5]HBE02329.1 glycoside hydrolase [Spirochaetia bacterium]
MINKFNDGRRWFLKKRLGLFIHWGLYALHGWHEQEQYRRRMRRTQYEKLIENFNPVHFNPEKWLDLAEAAGMEYIVFTAKHIDGFCLWHTGQTDYCIKNTPYREDILAQLASACRRRNFPLCLYYSIVDNHHHNYPNKNRTHELTKPEDNDQPNQERYLEFLYAQIRELCTGYGEIHGIWWDANRLGSALPELNNEIHRLQPKAVINDRGFSSGDFLTLEREYSNHSQMPAYVFEQPVEGCQSIGKESWGYKIDEDYYRIGYLTSSIDEFLAKGGNYLLNAGPAADGSIPAEARRILKAIGRWYRKICESFIDTEPVSLRIDPLLLQRKDNNLGALLTRRKNILYAHLHSSWQVSSLVLRSINIRPLRAVLLNTGRKLECNVDDIPSVFPDSRPCLRIRGLPVDTLANSTMVIKLVFKNFPEILETNPADNIG